MRSFELRGSVRAPLETGYDRDCRVSALRYAESRGFARAVQAFLEEASPNGFACSGGPVRFQGEPGAEEVADCVEAGVCKALPGVEVLKVPMVDGGEGFTKTLVNVTGGTIHRLTVTGPFGEPVEPHQRTRGPLRCAYAGS
jgi:hypothetical protein